MTAEQGSIRARALQRRRNLDEESRRKASRIICNRLVNHNGFYAAANIACYLPMHDEVDPRGLIARAYRANKHVFIPVVTPARTLEFREIDPATPLKKSEFGLWEPQSGGTCPARKLDLVVVPLVAFDVDNHRVGMGGGYYDRTFAFLRKRKIWHKPKLIGIAFACQQVEKIRPNPWDVAVSRVVHEC